MKKIYSSLHRAIFRVIMLSVFLLVSGNKTQAQTKIYGLDHGHLVYFEYQTGVYDTVPIGTFTPTTNGTFGCAIDPYNGRYFFDAYPLHPYGPAEIVDLYAWTSGFTCGLENKMWLEYNCLNNSLIFDDMDGGFWSYDLENSILTRLSTIPAPPGYVDGED